MAETSTYTYEPHQRTQARLAGEVPGPVRVADQHPRDTAMARFNTWLALQVNHR